MLFIQARALALERGLDEFKGSPTWCYKFMKRNDLSVRQKTTIGQKLPDDWEEKVKSFLDFVENEKNSKEYSDASVGNMDEVPMSFDAPANRTVHTKGAKTVNVVTTGHEKTHFTAVLACMANGVKVRPMVIFKRKTMPKEKITQKVYVSVNQKGWMNEEEMGKWLENCWARRPGAIFSPKSLLVMDSMRAHLKDSVKDRCKRVNTSLAIIPGGLTKKLQPLDLSVNHIFKSNVRKCWEEWMANGK